MGVLQQTHECLGSDSVSYFMLERETDRQTDRQRDRETERDVHRRLLNRTLADFLPNRKTGAAEGLPNSIFGFPKTTNLKDISTLIAVISLGTLILTLVTKSRDPSPR